MPTMIVHSEVEATSGLVLEHLRAFADKLATTRFPYPRGTAVVLHPDVLKALNGVEGMPALVVANPEGTALGVVAIYTQQGQPTLSFVSAHQILMELDESASTSDS